MRKKTTIRLNPDQDIYEVGLKDRRFPWVWLLLPVILLVPVDSEVTFQVLINKREYPAVSADLRVTIQDQSGKPVEKEAGSTDSSGKKTFNVGSQFLGTRLFYLMTQGERYSNEWRVAAKPTYGCFEGEWMSEELNKAISDTVVFVPLKAEYLSFKIQVLDSTSHLPVDQADVRLRSAKGLKAPQVAKTDAGGELILTAFNCPDSFEFIASKTGYVGDTIRAPLKDLYQAGVDSLVQLELVRIPEDESCGSSTMASGGEGLTIKTINMGQSSGRFRFWYDAHSVPDEFKVYQGKYPDVDLNKDLLFSTNECVSGNEENYLSFDDKSNYVSVVVTGCQNGTAWNIVVDCPE